MSNDKLNSLPIQPRRYAVVISDCHLSAGPVHHGSLNPHEDFHFDNEMCAFLDYFSSGIYHEDKLGPVSVDLIINGDFFDFLNVPYDGEFQEIITESIAKHKTQTIINGHPKVMASLRRFAALPGKRIRYLVGNHDADLFFPGVRELIIKTWDPEGKFPSQKVEIITDRDSIKITNNLEIHHGNQFEAVHHLNFADPIINNGQPEPVLNMPWGSLYVLKILNHLKAERDYIDKIRPIKVFIIFGLLFDTLFTLRFIFLTSVYFIQTRFIQARKRKSNLRFTLQILKEELQSYSPNLEPQAREYLNRNPNLKTIIFGHTHYPMNRIYPDGKQYINTGTWTKMINLDYRRLGQHISLTFALITIDGEDTSCDLRQWVGELGPHTGFRN